MTAGDQRPPLGRPHPLCDEEHTDGQKADRTDQDDTKVCHRRGKVSTAEPATSQSQSAIATAKIENAGR